MMKARNSQAMPPSCLHDSESRAVFVCVENLHTLTRVDYGMSVGSYGRIDTTVHVSVTGKSSAVVVNAVLDVCAHVDTGTVVWKDCVPNPPFVLLSGGFTASSRMCVVRACGSRGPVALALAHAPAPLRACGSHRRVQLPGPMSRFTEEESYPVRPHCGRSCRHMRAQCHFRRCVRVQVQAHTRAHAQAYARARGTPPAQAHGQGHSA